MEAQRVKYFEIILEKISDEKKRCFLQVLNEGKIKLPPFPDIKGLLTRLANLGMKLALVLSDTEAAIVLDIIGLKHFFEPNTILTGRDIGKDSYFLGKKLKGKPAPDKFQEAALRLGIDYNKPIGFEDAWSGIQAINAAGMTSIGIDREMQGHLSSAHYALRSFTLLH
ncbi:MAG TPA: hypothetical protein DCS13_00390 [Candidatus Margulisbacteria bacterium]|nr:hypothetical protein [Candidatus Margulisiibacteriota bacterium]